MLQFAQIQTTNSEHGQFGRQALQKADVSKCLRETEKFFRSREGWEVPGDLHGGITTNPLGISQKNGMVYDASQMMSCEVQWFLPKESKRCISDIVEVMVIVTGLNVEKCIWKTKIIRLKLDPIFFLN